MLPVKWTGRSPASLQKDELAVVLGWEGGVGARIGSDGVDNGEKKERRPACSEQGDVETTWLLPVVQPRRLRVMYQQAGRGGTLVGQCPRLKPRMRPLVCPSPSSLASFGACSLA